jgi:hypothetical protein
MVEDPLDGLTFKNASEGRFGGLAGSVAQLRDLPRGNGQSRRAGGYPR